MQVSDTQGTAGAVWGAEPAGLITQQGPIVRDAAEGGRSMVRNRSVPAETVLPHITYQNVAEALAWLAAAFGFTEHYRYGEQDGRVSGAQMHLGGAWIMLNSARAGSASPAQIGCQTQSLTVFVDDVDAHFERAKTAGARIVEDLHETAYGERQYGVEDLEGHRWLFSKHVRDVSPGEWGAAIADR